MSNLHCFLHFTFAYLAFVYAASRFFVMRLVAACNRLKT